MLKYLYTISSHTDHMLLLDVHHLKDRNSRYNKDFKTRGLSKDTSPPLHCPHKFEYWEKYYDKSISAAYATETKLTAGPNLS